MPVCKNQSIKAVSSPASHYVIRSPPGFCRTLLPFYFLCQTTSPCIFSSSVLSAPPTFEICLLTFSLFTLPSFHISFSLCFPFICFSFSPSPASPLSFLSAPVLSLSSASPCFVSFPSCSLSSAPPPPLSSFGSSVLQLFRVDLLTLPLLCLHLVSVSTVNLNQILPLLFTLACNRLSSVLQTEQRQILDSIS